MSRLPSLKHTNLTSLTLKNDFLPFISLLLIASPVLRYIQASVNIHSNVRDQSISSFRFDMLFETVTCSDTVLFPSSRLILFLS